MQVQVQAGSGSKLLLLRDRALAGGRQGLNHGGLFRGGPRKKDQSVEGKRRPWFEALFELLPLRALRPRDPEICCQKVPEEGLRGALGGSPDKLKQRSAPRFGVSGRLPGLPRSPQLLRDWELHRQPKAFGSGARACRLRWPPAHSV